jgi:hypothetical protein
MTPAALAQLLLANGGEIGPTLRVREPVWACPVIVWMTNSVTTLPRAWTRRGRNEVLGLDARGSQARPTSSRS